MAIQFLDLDEMCDPRSFLSEGHLDSLGLCLYLATVRTFNPPGTVLVLDDVLTSVDKDHRTRVTELLLENFGDFQLVLTTHEEYWFDTLQSKVQARGESGNWKFERIVRWTVDGGPETASFESTWAYIEENLVEEHYRELGGPMRVVLEDFLKRTAEKLEVKVPYKATGKYVAGDFVVAGVRDRLREELLEAEPGEEANIKQEIGRVFGVGDLINVLSHDNPVRIEATLGDVRDFVTGLKALSERCTRNQLIRGIRT